MQKSQIWNYHFDAVPHICSCFTHSYSNTIVNCIILDLYIFSSLSNNSPLVSNDVIFQLDESSLSALWYYNDTEQNTADIHDNIIDNWYIVGTNPYSNDLYDATYLEITDNGKRALDVGAVSPAKDGEFKRCPC